MLKQSLFFLLLFAHLSAEPIILQAKTREIVVKGKKAQVYEIAPLSLSQGEQFNVIVENKLDVPTGIHWHGLILPNNQDGVPFVTQAPIPPGGKYSYNFPLVQAGTFWMHAHYGLQEQLLLAAPLIIHAKESVPSQQAVVMFLSDFTFQNPLDVFKELKQKRKMEMRKEADLYDVTYDAFLTNWKSLSVIEVQPGKEILLRVINGASSTNFFLSLGSLKGQAVATDGSPIQPLSGTEFSLGVAQRLDIKLTIPESGGSFPIIAKGEGQKLQTGLFLTTKGAKPQTIPEVSNEMAGAITYAQEFQFKALYPLEKKKVNRSLTVNLEGDMANYVWLINQKAWPHNEPLVVKEGERVEMVFINHTSMSHPMHLHGHVFQVTNINGIPFNGALRDTILVLPHSTVRIEFDAVHPGNWPLHCHNLYHQFAGMMTTLNYEGFKGPVFTPQEKEQELKNP